MATNKLVLATLAFLAFLILVLTGVIIWQQIRISDLQADADVEANDGDSMISYPDAGTGSDPVIDMATEGISFSFADGARTVELNFAETSQDWAIFAQDIITKDYTSEARLWADSDDHLEEIVYLSALDTYYLYDSPGSVLKMTLVDKTGFEELHAGNDAYGNVEVCTAENKKVGQANAIYGVCDNTYTEGSYSSTTYNNYCAFQLDDKYLFFKYALVPNSTDVSACLALESMDFENVSLTNE